MPHPLEFISQHLRKPLFYFFFALTLLIFGVFSQLDQPLRNVSAPSGIVSFELALTPERADEIVLSWKGVESSYLDFFHFDDGYYVPPRIYAAFGLGFDYLFMPVYSLALSLGLLLAIGNKTNWYRSFASLLGWGAFAAALFDAVENYALWHTLTSGAFSPYPEIAALCATIKFTLLLMGFITIAAGKLIQK